MRKKHVLPLAALVAIPLALGPAGTLELVYYQGHVELENTLERATSADGGITWTHATLAHPGRFTTARGLPCFPGDYIGTTIAGGSLFIAYSDNNDGRAHTAFLRVASP